MHLGSATLALALGSFPYCTASWAGLLGPPYPPPRDVSSNSSAVYTAWRNFTATIEATIAPKIAESKFQGLANFTISVGMFSLNDPGTPQLQFHHTGESVKMSGVGVNAVNGDSVYRIASATKVFKVYLLLLKLGSSYWARPISDFVPDLTSTTDVSASDPLRNVEWEKVTLGSLAAHMAGITRNPAPYANDILQLFPQKDAIAQGLPPLEISLLSPCAQIKDLACPTKEYVSNIAHNPPIFLPWDGPAYSNAGYALLGLAIEKITSRSLDPLFNDDIFQPLRMTSSSYKVPSNLSHAVVPGGATNVSFAVDYGTAGASGGVYSTTNDLSKIGIAILNSTLLSHEETRKWLKPVTHTADLQFSVGHAWEILRLPQGPGGRVIDLYTKAGDVAHYSSYLVLSPDHGVGFSALTADVSDQVPLANAFVADTLASSIIPAVESQAAHETAVKIAGLYRTNQTNLNSSVNLAVRGHGLVLQSWISNGTDLLPQLKGLFGDVDIILFPSISDTRRGEIAFRAVGGPGITQDTGPFSRQLFENGGWTGIDLVQYGGLGLDLFVFDVDRDGYALAVTPAATRATLRRVH